MRISEFVLTSRAPPSAAACTVFARSHRISTATSPKTDPTPYTCSFAFGFGEPGCIPTSTLSGCGAERQAVGHPGGGGLRRSTSCVWLWTCRSVLVVLVVMQPHRHLGLSSQATCQSGLDQEQVVISK